MIYSLCPLQLSNNSRKSVKSAPAPLCPAEFLSSETMHFLLFHRDTLAMGSEVQSSKVQGFVKLS